MFREEAVSPPSASTGSGFDCSGNALSPCAAGSAGPDCSLTCSAGFTTCETRFYCNADETVYGMIGSGTHFFSILGSDDTERVRDALVDFVVSNEDWFGWPNGLSSSDFDIRPAEDMYSELGYTRIFRLHQMIDRAALPGPVRVTGDGSLLTIEADRTGAVSFKGTLVDPRTTFLHETNYASVSAAETSIKRQVYLRTGISPTSLDVHDTTMVVVAARDTVAYRGVVHRAGHAVSLARVTVEADPSPPGGLHPLISYETFSANGLEHTHQATVRSEERDDSTSDLYALPVYMEDYDELADGAPLLGSTEDASGDLQLATENVVTLGLSGAAIGSVSASQIVHYLSSGNTFLENHPGEEFNAQFTHHYGLEAFNLAHSLAAGAWDSALPIFDDANGNPRVSDYPPGTFTPRALVLHDADPQGGPAAIAQLTQIGGGAPTDEFEQQPPAPVPMDENEPITYIPLGLGKQTAPTIMHEFGHVFDNHMAPSLATFFLPAPPPPADMVCNEDTTDEAPPLVETAAQLFLMWQLQRIAGREWGDCSVIEDVKRSDGSATLAHHPSCMDENDVVRLFLRDDDPGCPNSNDCDKPSAVENGMNLPGVGYACDHREGYSTGSIFQAWWNTLHGYYCEPPSADWECTPVATAQFPPGCGPGTGIECVSPDEAAVLSLIYSLRTNPITYEQFFDSMMTFVACNYGADAYQLANQALCDHEIRDCSAMLPTSCEVCGNGIREGGEECDGNDLSIAELGGATATCETQGYESGTLQCFPPGPQGCTYDVSMCNAGLDTTAGGSSSSSGTSSGSSGESSGSGGTGAGGGPVEDGCSCRAGRSDGGWSAGLLVVLALWRRRRKAAHRSPASIAANGRLAAAVGLVVGGCGPNAPTSDGSTTTEQSESGEDPSTGTHGASSGSSASESAGSEMTPGWPELWYGDYYRSEPLHLDDPQPAIGAVVNFTLSDSGGTWEWLYCDGRVEAIAGEYADGAVDIELDSVGLGTGSSSPRRTTTPVPSSKLVRLDEDGEMAGSFRLQRGRLYVSQECDGGPIWAVSLDPDTPTDCSE